MTALWSPPTGRSAGLHSSLLSSTKAHSIRLKSGLSAGKEERPLLLPLPGCPCCCCDRRIVGGDEIAWPEFGVSTCSTEAWNALPSIRPSSTMAATMPWLRTPATEVVIFLCPRGTGQRRRSPRGVRPWGRALAVEAPSGAALGPVAFAPTHLGRPMNLDSNWIRFFNQAQRWLKTSGRSCSKAGADFC